MRAETGYGYILAEKPSARADAWPVIRFIEKPDAPTAERYVASGNYFWNSGMFLWNNRTLLELFAALMPETYKGLCALRPLLGKTAADSRMTEIFASLPRISIDYGIMEKSSGLRLIPAEFAWDDIGNWASLERALAPDAHGQYCAGLSCLAGFKRLHHLCAVRNGRDLRRFGFNSCTSLRQSSCLFQRQGRRS